MKSSIYTLLSFLTICLLITSCAEPSIVGKVTDKSDDSPLIGCQVHLFQDDKLQELCYTNLDGEFHFNNVKEGRYNIRTSNAGYINDSLVNFEFKESCNRYLDIQLRDITSSSVAISGWETPTLVRKDSILGTVTGKVTEVSTDKVCETAYLKLIADDGTVLMTSSDEEGKYKFRSLGGGNYTLEVCNAGYAKFEQKNITIACGSQLQAIDVKLSASESTDELACLSYKEQLAELDLAAEELAETESIDDEIIVKGSRSEVSGYHVDGRRVKRHKKQGTKDYLLGKSKSQFGSTRSAKASPSYPVGRSSSRTSRRTAGKTYTSADIPDAGQLTAGEWNDLNNWSDWNKLVKDGDYKSMNEYWSIDYKERYSVFVTNYKSLPVANSKVQLKSQDGKVIWHAITDNNGRAELWSNVPDNKKLKIEVLQNKQTFKIKSPKVASKGSNYLNIPLTCNEYKEMDIFFVVDATSSMSDEINYLRSELNDVIGQVIKEQKDKIDFRLGVSFYKDSSDDYIVKTSNLSSDIEKTTDFIKTKSAGGGGDFPEAVEVGLESALKQKWNPDALNRIVFLLLDAPPHHNKAVLNKINKQIQEFAKKGIKLVPITASGIDRQTEFLMKQMSILTNGTYVFLTDHSGIGESHLEHIIPDYEVEKLNDLLNRLITNYAQTYDCEKEVIKEKIVQYKMYPNPAITDLTIELDSAIDQIIIYSSTGKRMQAVEKPKKGNNKIQLSDYAAGMYTVRLINKGKVIGTQKLMIVS